MWKEIAESEAPPLLIPKDVPSLVHVCNIFEREANQTLQFALYETEAHAISVAKVCCCPC